MIGIIIYVYFLLLGFLYADLLFKDKELFSKVWIGGIIGNLILMAGIVPIAFIFKFTILSHILLILLSAAPYIIISARHRESCIIQGKKLSLNTNNTDMTYRVFLAVILPVTLVICILMFNHILYPKQNSFYSGQSTFGDLQMHLGFVTSIAEQHKFPPDYSFLQGTRLCYPFFIDMLSSSLYLFGTSLRWAVLIPSFAFALMIVMGFYCLAYALTGRKSIAVMSVIFFFFNGAFGFTYFLNGAKSDPSVFTQIFTEYYKTPTNLNEQNIRWANTICDAIIPQRTTMAGWTYIIFALWLLTDAMKTNSRKKFIILGVTAGCMPMIHTHSFLALGIISAVMLLCTALSAKDKKTVLMNWLFYGGIALVLALPQLILWTFSQTGGNDSFLNYHFNWVNHDDPYLWFYIKNWGLVFLFIIPAFLNTSKQNKMLMAGGAVIFAIAEFIQFQPNEYDNNKLFFITYMLALILTTELFADIYVKMKGIKARQYIAGLVIVTSTFSGVLTVIREWKSGGEYQTFSSADIEYAEFIKENTPSDAVFLTDSHHLNPVVSLAGRTIYTGSSLYVFFHGLGDEWRIRNDRLQTIYSGSYEQMKKFADENNISYISVTNYEKGDFKVNETALSQFEKVYDKGGCTLYYTGY